MFSGPFGFRYFSNLAIIVTATAYAIYRAYPLLPLDAFPLMMQFTMPAFIGYPFMLMGLYWMLRADLIHIHLAHTQPHFSRKFDRLVTIGPYAYNRHPYRSAYFLHSIGWFLIFSYPTPMALIIPLVFFLFWSLTLHFWEERRLAQQFGDEYREYYKRVPYLNWRLKIEDHEQYPFIQQLAWVLCIFYFRMKYRLRASRLGNIPRQGPFLVVSAHESYFDPFMFGVFIPFSVNYVTTSDVFTSKRKQAMLKAIGTFPIQRHKQDLKAIRTMLRLLAKDQAVCIFPEGGRTMDGAPQPIAVETMKLIKRCKVPILPVRIEGLYEIWPRWTDHRRQGRMHVDFLPVIDYDPEMDIETLEQKIRESIFLEKLTYQPSKDKLLTPGIDTVLWACIECNARESIEITGPRSVHCKECGETWSMDDHYHFIPSGDKIGHSIYAWLEILRSGIKPFAEFTIDTDQEGSENIYLKSSIEEYFSSAGSEKDPGVLYLTERRFVLYGGGLVRDWRFDQIRVFTLDFENGISLGVSGERHAFKLPRSETPMKWSDTYDFLISNGSDGP